MPPRLRQGSLQALEHHCLQHRVGSRASTLRAIEIYAQSEEDCLHAKVPQRLASSVSCGLWPLSLHAISKLDGLYDVNIILKFGL